MCVRQIGTTNDRKDHDRFFLPPHAHAGCRRRLSPLGPRHSLDARDGRSAGPSADTLVFLNYRDLRDLNPHLYGGEMFAQEMLFEGLITLGNDGVYHPAVAESWTISPDGRVYTFRIRKGLMFTDGEKLDAHAVQANFDALIDNKKRHTWLEMMRLLVSAKAGRRRDVRHRDEGAVLSDAHRVAVTASLRLREPEGS